MENQLDEMIEYFEDDILDDHFENYRKNIVTIIAYLIGVPDEKLLVEDRVASNEYENINTNITKSTRNFIMYDPNAL